MSELVIDRFDAKKQGLVRYFTNKPCKNEHISDRYVTDGKCVECNRIKMQKYWVKYPEAVAKRNEYLRTRKERNPEAYQADQKYKKYRWANDATYKEAGKQSAKENHVKRYANPEYVELCRQQSLEWAKNNRGKYRAKVARRRAALKNATPKWVNYDEITKIYENCPSGYHVDHVIPLNSKIVSGLHVPWNLQYLPAYENLSKGNRLLVG
jgi:hypothetical protein